MANTIFTILFGILCILISFGLGLKIFRLFHVTKISKLERTILSVSLGFAIIAYGIFILGLVGKFEPLYFALWLFILLIVSLTEYKEMISTMLSNYKKTINLWRKLHHIHKFLVITLVGVLFLISLQALTPVWDYDGLMYHLEGPRRFLSIGRISPLQDIHQANGPFLIEMLFSIGVAFGIAPIAKIFHLIFALILVAATFTFSNRYFGGNEGWIPAVILITTPSFLIYSSFAYIDIAWATYVFLSIYSILIWQENNDRNWLYISGTLTGFALGCKYLALGYAVILIIFVAWISRKRRWKFIVKNTLIFGALASLIGGPWYLKNLIWTGNPVYPLFFGGPGWPEERVQFASSYINSFGTGHSFSDYVLLPWNLYFKHNKFTTMRYFEILNPLFILSLVYPLVRKNKSINYIATFTLLGFILWAMGSQQIRFLLPLFPGFSIIAGYVFVRMAHHIHNQRFQRIFIPGILGGLIIVSLVSAFSYFREVQPVGVLAGIEGRNEFLSRVEGNYSALKYLQDNQQPDERVFMIWDGRSYYCDRNCVPDTDNSQWTYLVNRYKDVPTILDYFRRNRVAYLLVNTINAYFMLEHDPNGEQLEAISFLAQDFIPACAEEVFSSNEIMVYQITCID